MSYIMIRMCNFGFLCCGSEVQPQLGLIMCVLLFPAAMNKTVKANTTTDHPPRQTRFVKSLLLLQCELIHGGGL